VTSPHTRKLRVLYSNGCARHVSWHLLHCCLRALPSNGWSLQTHLPATGLSATILIQLLILWISSMVLTAGWLDSDDINYEGCSGSKLLAPSFLPSFLPTPRRYSSGCALASWTISLLSSMRWLMAVSVRDTFLSRSFSCHAALPCWLNRLKVQLQNHHEYKYHWCRFPFNPSIWGWLSGFWTI
jgi:hypothetical protein